jgi:hypothetical protein
VVAVDGTWTGPVAEATFRLPFLRGDVNRDRTADLADVIGSLEYLFLDGPAPRPLVAADTNDDGAVDLSDGVFLLTYLFMGGPALPPPYPEPGLLP